MWPTVFFSVSVSVVIIGVSLLVYYSPLATQWDQNNNSTIVSFLDSVARFNHDHDLSISERLDILKSQHLINADQLAQYQILQDQMNPYEGSLAWGWSLAIFGILVTAVSTFFAGYEWADYYDSYKLKKRMTSR